jgi:DUF4097 and DUF4098 domain-containing protein YvlB
MKASVALAALVLAPACHIDFDDGTFLVDGVRLTEQHEENLEIPGWHSQGLKVELAAGDARVRPTDGPTRIVATVHEKYLHDARIEYVGGRLVVETDSGEPAAIGDLTVWTGERIPELSISTGAGDIDVEHVEILGSLTLSSGFGDISVEEGGRLARCDFSTGMGDIALASFVCDDLEATSGMGDVELRSIECAVAELSTGMGDVDVLGSRFDRLEASTGMGDVDASRTEYGSASLDSGMGSVRTGERRYD